MGENSLTERIQIDDCVILLDDLLVLIESVFSFAILVHRKTANNAAGLSIQSR